MASPKQIKIGDHFKIDLRNQTKEGAHKVLSRSFYSIDAERAINRKKQRIKSAEKTAKDRLKEIKSRGLKPGMQIQYGDETLTIKGIGDQGYITFEERRGACGSPWRLTVLNPIPKTKGGEKDE